MQTLSMLEARESSSLQVGVQGCPWPACATGMLMQLSLTQLAGTSVLMMLLAHSLCSVCLCLFVLICSMMGRCVLKMGESSTWMDGWVGGCR